MKEKHNDWSIAQQYNCRYWQSTARMHHREELERFKQEHQNLTINLCPEAHGVHVHELMIDTANIELEWPPRNLARVISIAGYAKS